MYVHENDLFAFINLRGTCKMRDFPTRVYEHSANVAIIIIINMIIY